jgi:hypothetical protein
LERKFLNALVSGHHRLPEEAQKAIDEPRCIPDFFYAPNVCIFCDGSVHNEASQVQRDAGIRSKLVQHGYRLVVIRYDRDIRAQIDEQPDVFGKRVGTS